MPDDSEELGIPPTRLKRNRKTLALLLIPSVFFWLLATVGQMILLPKYVDQYPLLILATNARRSILAITAPKTPIYWWFLIGFVRQLVADPLFFFLGRVWGEDGVHWVEKNYGGNLYRRYEPWLRKGLYFFVLTAPNVIVCTLAGASRMRTRTFFILNIGGTIVFLGVIRVFGDIFEGPIVNVREFISRNWIPFTILGTVLFALNIASHVRRGGLDPVEDFEESLDEPDPD